MFLFDFEARTFLSYELLFCLIYINSKRTPDTIVMLWGIQLKSKIFYLKNLRCFFTLCFFNSINYNRRGYS